MPPMKPSSFQYHRPDSVAEALRILSTHDNARILAGGQSLMPMLNMRIAAVDHLVDINRIAELAGMSIGEEGTRIGAMVRQEALLDHPELAERVPILGEALSHVGHLPTRTRGTIGGSLAHLDPSAELPAIAALHDATIVLRGAAGERRVPMAEFAVDYLTPDIAPDEILVAVELPFWPVGHGWGFVEFAYRHGDFAIVAVGALLMADPRRQSIERVAVVLAGVDHGPVRLAAAEHALIGAPFTEDSWHAAADCTRDIEPLSDHMASAAYRKRLARVLTERALRRAAARALAPETDHR
jgi:aerobic carbon-monoxide dehydrogenase medium subunit